MPPQLTWSCKFRQGAEPGAVTRKELALSGVRRPLHGAELGLAVRRYSGFGTLRDGRKGEGTFPAEPIGRVSEIWIPRTPVAVFVASSLFLLRIIPLFKSIGPSNRHGWDLVASGERRQEDGSAVRVEGGSALAAVGRSGIWPMSNPVAEVAAAKSYDPHPEYVPEHFRKMFGEEGNPMARALYRTRA